jgi:hypothetical protein
MPLTSDEAAELKQAILNGSLDDPLELLKLVDTYENPQVNKNSQSNGPRTNDIWGVYATSTSNQYNFYNRDPFWDIEPEISIQLLVNIYLNISICGVLRGGTALVVNQQISTYDLAQLGSPATSQYQNYISNLVRNMLDSFSREIARHLTNGLATQMIIQLLSKLQNI